MVLPVGTLDNPITRRTFLSAVGAGTLGLATARCGAGSSGETSQASDLPPPPDAAVADHGGALDAHDVEVDTDAAGDVGVEVSSPIQLSAPSAVISEELVTIGADAFAVAWVTQTELPDALAVRDEGGEERILTSEYPPRRFHLLEVPGLEPGRSYEYRTTEGALGGADPYGLSPRTLTTLLPPTGKRLLRFATMNDVHIGTEQVGLIQGIGSPMSWPDPDNPHYLFSARSAVAGINDRDVDFTIIKGDLTGEYTLDQFETARQVLDELAAPYYPMRGNHDRVGENPEDYFLKVFGDKLPDKSRAWFAMTHAGVRFLCLDSNRLEDGWPEVSEEQLAWLAAELAAHASAPTFVLLHHAVTAAATMVFTLLGENRKSFIDTVAPHDQVVGILSGHSHRDAITYEAALGSIPCIETAATLHYPSGYAVYDVYSNGYVQTSYRLGCPECLEWAEMTKNGLYEGTALDLLYLPAVERCFTHLF